MIKIRLNTGVVILRIFLISGLFCALSMVQLQSQSRYKYEIEKVSNDIFLLRPVINKYRWVTSNIVVIINKEDLLVIDSGLLPSAAEEAITHIKNLTTKPVKYLINTHWHGDHWQGNVAFANAYPGIKIITSAKNKAAIERNGNVWARKHYRYFLNRMVKEYQETLIKEREGKNDELTVEEELLVEHGIIDMNKDIEELKDLELIIPNITFDKKMILKSGGRIIELQYPGPGNTIGDVIVWLPKEKVLFTGDLVVYPSPYESGAFSQDWIDTNRKLQADFKYKLLIPGHGEIQRDTVYLSYINDLFKEIVLQMEAAYVNGTFNVDDAQRTVTFQSVTEKLNKNLNYRKYTEKLDKAFISSAIRSSFLSLINGKMKG